jgi:hypothetical protein
MALKWHPVERQDAAVKRRIRVDDKIEPATGRWRAIGAVDIDRSEHTAAGKHGEPVSATR